jgi:hypothetical protein
MTDALEGIASTRSAAGHRLSSEASRRSRLRVRVFVLTLTLVAGACSSAGSPGEEAASGSPDGTATMDEDAPFRLSDGALLGAMLTTDPVEDASARPGLVFTTDDTEVAAIVSLGEEVEEGSTVSFTWSSLSGIDEREALFTHDVQVGPGGEAVSVGVAEDGLAPGRYEVAVELGEASVLLPFRVEVAGGGSATASSAEAMEDWEVPSPGESSWYEPTPTAPPPPPGPCEIAGLTTSFDPMRTAEASATWIGECSTMALEAAVSGPPTAIASLATIPAGTPAWIHGAIDLCELPGGSDLPGAVVRWTATGSEGARASATYTVPDLGDTLMAELASVPDPGHVEPGQRIALRGMAMVMPTALGVRELTLSVNGQELERVGNVSETSSPEPCDDGRYGAVTYTHHDVPQDAPALIEICAHATGFDGTEAEHCVSFSTGQTWTGTVHATSRGSACEGVEDGTVTLTVAGTDVTGGFDASGSYTCDPGIETPTSGSVRLSGVLDEEGFSLSVDATDGFLASSVVCLVEEAFEIPVTGDTASASFHTTAPSGDVYDCTFQLERTGASP